MTCGPGGNPGFSTQDEGPTIRVLDRGEQLTEQGGAEGIAPRLVGHRDRAHVRVVDDIDESHGSHGAMVGRHPHWGAVANASPTSPSVAPVSSWSESTDSTPTSYAALAAPAARNHSTPAVSGSPACCAAAM